MKFDAKNIVIIILIILIILSVGFIAVNLLNNDSNSKDSSFLVDDNSASKKDSFSIHVLRKIHIFFYKLLFKFKK